ncbi:methyltransferase, FxLD system [Actinomadura rayongensis]|nr:methyltransferase, FxLD system [Actinomadura rayongensis]
MDTAIPEVLHARLVDGLVSGGHVRAPAVETAMRTVPRHLFLPQTPVEDAYADRIVVTKRFADGTSLSSASQPSVVAAMLEQAAVQPGERVLEIGAGTGYNAALLRELVGDGGRVATIDIDPDVTREAHENLTAAGYDDVHVATGDGADGVPTDAPYDLIIVTSGAWDIPAGWWAQLAEHGRIVVPLRWRGLTRSLALDYHGGIIPQLTSRSMLLCGFISMRGDSDGERIIDIADDVALHVDQDLPLDADTLRGVLDRPRTESWADAIIGGDVPFDGIWLRLSIADPGTCRIKAQRSAVDAERATPAIPGLSPAVAEGDSLAYLASRRAEDGTGWQMGAIGHGPRGAELAGRLVRQIDLWHEDRAAQPSVALFPAGTPDDQRTGDVVINKRDSRMTFTW